jgi:hypothetical protein
MGNHFHLVIQTPRARKARLAARLRAETTMTRPWIAERLVMGHWRTALNATRASALKG